MLCAHSSWIVFTIISKVICTRMIYEGVCKSFQTGHLERELQMVQLSAIRCSYSAILWVSLVSFAAITLCIASQQVFIVVISLSIQSGNFWIHPLMFIMVYVVLNTPICPTVLRVGRRYLSLCTGACLSRNSALWDVQLLTSNVFCMLQVIVCCFLYGV
jgi:hypothetical protein